MKKQILTFINKLENERVDKKELLDKISFNQNERLIHLQVTI